MTFLCNRRGWSETGLAAGAFCALLCESGLLLGFMVLNLHLMLGRILKVFACGCHPVFSPALLQLPWRDNGDKVLTSCSHWAFVSILWFCEGERTIDPSVQVYVIVLSAPRSDIITDLTALDLLWLHFSGLLGLKQSWEHCSSSSEGFITMLVLEMRPKYQILMFFWFSLCFFIYFFFQCWWTRWKCRRCIGSWRRCQKRPWRPAGTQRSTWPNFSKHSPHSSKN